MEHASTIGDYHQTVQLLQNAISNTLICSFLHCVHKGCPCAIGSLGSGYTETTHPKTANSNELEVAW
jgi:hypothetical protein